MLPGLAPSVVAKGAPTILNTHSVLLASGGATQTYNSVPIGTENGRDLVVVHATMAISGSATLLSATIGGVAASILGQSGGTNAGVALIQAEGVIGTTATVVLNWSANVARGGIGVWNLGNLQSKTQRFLHNPAGGGIATRSVTLDFLPHAVGVIGIGNNESPSTWTNATEAYDLQELSNGISGAYYVSPSGETGRVISATNGRAIIGATWR